MSTPSRLFVALLSASIAVATATPARAQWLEVSPGSLARPPVAAPAPLDGDDGSLSIAARRASGAVGRTRFFLSNAEAWFARWEILKLARQSIDVQYFIIEGDLFGMSMLGVLLERQRAGVHVRLMVDARGTKGFARTAMGQDYLQELVNAGAEVKVFNPVFSNGPSVEWQTSNHDKIVLVDGRYFVTGGRNVSKSYFADNADLPTAYMDACILVDSSGAAPAVKQAFDVEFASPLNYVVKPDRHGNWRSRAPRLQAAVLAMTELLEGRISAASRRAFPEVDTYPATAARYRSFSLFDDHARRPVELIDNTSTVAQAGSALSDAVHAAIREARSEIVMMNPYIVLTEGARAALKAAAARGVSIKLFTNGPLSTDSALTQAVFIYEWPQILKEIPTARIFAARGPEKLHAKVFVFDGRTAIVSSFNLDYISEGRNSEIGVKVRDLGFARIVRKEIMDRIERRAVEFKLEPGMGPEQITGSERKTRFLRDYYYRVAKRIRPML